MTSLHPLFRDPRAYWLQQARIKAEFALDWRSQGFTGFAAAELEDLRRYIGVARGFPIRRAALPH